MPIKLFDLTNSTWTRKYSLFASISFDEELKLYELIDIDAAEDAVNMDAAGDADIDIDCGTEDILAA